MSSFNISGLMSGLDVDGIITQLMAIERQPITRLETQKTLLTNKQTAYEAFATQLIALKASAMALAKQSTFQSIVGNTSDSSVARVSTTTDATPGSYAIQVDSLATNHKISSQSYASKETALGLSGDFIVNGKTVSVGAEDTLTSILTKINTANAGVKATIIQVSSSEYRLSIASSTTGVANKIHLADTGSSDLLQSMRLLSSSTHLGSPITGGAASSTFEDNISSIGSLLDLPSAQSGTIQIKGVDIAIDLATDSLQSIADRINTRMSEAEVTGVTAQVAAVEEDGVTKYKLEIAGAGEIADYGDSNNILSTMGVLAHDYANQTTEAVDAQIKIDGVIATRSTNTISDLIPGVTLFLSKVGDTTVSLSRDTSSMQQAVQSFVDRYNAVHDYVANQSSFDTESKTSGVLFGDYTMLGIESDMANILGRPVNGLWESLDDRGAIINTLSGIGITQDSKGKLALDTGKLTAALSQNPEAVSALFAVKGTTSNAAIGFVSAGKYGRATYSIAEPRLRSAYDIIITQAAEQATITGTTQSTGASAEEEKLTFSGGLFSTNVEVTIPTGSTLQNTVDQLNRDTRLNGKIVASIEDNKLVLKSARYGSSSSAFSVVSDKEASALNSGIGQTTLSDTGLDVAGTIGGYAAVGKGQLLTGIAGAQAKASVAQTAVLAQDETLTFSGGIFDNEPINLTLTAGMTQDEVMAAINDHEALSKHVEASVQNGVLTIESVRKGTDVRFNVISNREAASDSTGIGWVVDPITHENVPIAADSRNSPGDIQLLVKVTPQELEVHGGAYGDLTLTQGIGDVLDRYLTQVTDSIDGRITTATESVRSQMKYMDTNIAMMEARMLTVEARIRGQFTAMESLMGQLQSTSTYLTSQLSSLGGWSTNLGGSANSSLSALLGT